MVSYKIQTISTQQLDSVLILIVVEDGLVLLMTKKKVKKIWTVLILIVVEDGLVLSKESNNGLSKLLS